MSNKVLTMDETLTFSHVRMPMTHEAPMSGRAALAQVEAYWNDLRTFGQLPSRDDVKPSALSGALEYVALINRVDTGIFRVRFAGRHICDLMGMEVRGMPLTALIRPGQRHLLADALENVASGQSLTRLSLCTNAVRGELLLLPLAPDARGQTHILACFVSTASAAHAPCRFDITDVREEVLSVGAEPITVPARSREMGFAEAADAFHGKPTKVPFLRLIEPQDG